MACKYPSALIPSYGPDFLLAGVFLLLLMCSPSVQAQTSTYYLHKESSSTNGQLQLKTALPDAAAYTVQSAELRNQPNGDYLIKAFDTQANIPNSQGVIPTGSAIKFKLWMRKTDNFGTMYARVKLALNNTSGSTIVHCTEPFGTQGGPNTYLTTSFAARSFTCYTATEVTMTATDRFYLWVGVQVSAVGNNRVKAELRMEQGSDSNVVIPIPAPRPTISSLSPDSGPVDTPVVVTGSNFGATQGASTVTFNGLMASPSSWSDSRIDARVPVGTTTGPVVVTLKIAAGYYVKSIVGNSVNYSVSSGTLAGTITATSTGAGIPGAFVEALESGLFVAGARTNTSGAYSFGGLRSGSYDIRVSADGYKTDTSPAIVVSVGTNTTFNVSLYKPGAITGRVTKSDGVTPLGGATVKVYQGAPLVGRTLTNSAGDYTLDELRPGTSKVQASAPGYQPQVQSGITVSEQATSTSNFSLNSSSHTDSIKHNYDELGRLVTVEDKTGQAAKYSYDATGNLLAISRHLPTQVSILDFTPSKGVEGTVVTISGTSFSATTTENTVSFNGAVGTVISANPSQIVVAAPPGVTTGPLSVTSPAGSAASATQFTLDTLAPLITGFSPTIADPAASVTINGTNFEALLSNNGTAIGISRAPLTSGTTTELIVTVPIRGGSGKVTVNTPFGKALSADDFFYPPRTSYSGCCTTAQVVYTGRMAIGETKAVPINTPNKIGLVIFDAVAGQRIGYTINNTVTPATTLRYSIFNPDGSILRDSTSVNPNSTSFVDNNRQASLFGHYTVGVPVTGTYTIMIELTGSSTAQPNVTLSEIPPDTLATISPGGPTKTVSIAAAGQNGQLTFFGIAGQRISLKIANSTFPGALKIYDPNGITFRDHSISTDNNNANTRFIDTLTLPASGKYTILVDPSTSWTGSVELTLYEVPPDVLATIVPGGPPVNVITTVPGQDARLTFSGTVGQRVSLHVLNTSVRSCTVIIYNPDGTVLTQSTGPTINNGGSGFLDTKTLPATGTYSILLNANTTAGSMTATLYNVPEDITGNITINGPALGVPITVPGQNGNVYFNGTAGQLVTVRMTGNTLHPVLITLIKPDGTTLTSASSSSSSFNLAQKSLPTGGTYRISVNPIDIDWTSGAWSPNTGTVNVTVTSP